MSPKELKELFDGTDWGNIDSAQKFIVEWANSVFPTRTAYNAMSKLVLEEIPEMLMAERDGAEDLDGEAADVLCLYLDWCYMKGINIQEGLRRKMYRNAFNRTWGEVGPGGMWRHKEEVI